MTISPEDAAAYITAIGVIGTGINIVIMLIVKNTILQIKVWAREEFVAKRDAALYLGPFRQGLQERASVERLQS